ncbi:restriction endonuclease subunit S [Lysinibacillus capsici]|uniref:restriction endonuclease subunit S n=1 Tax=Lysinibacillus capsici TaxID=2115968 RepID=UPI0028B22CD9|nr:restriction endonuclease subunit S [Lysinibacillus capsici]
MSKKVPEIRFKGYNDEWISNKLGAMIGISSASRVHKDEWTSEGIPFFRSSDVISKYMKKYNTPAFISDTLYQELSKKSGKMKTDDLLVTGGGTIGIPYLIESEDPLYFKDADLIWLKNSGVIDGSFLYNFYISPQTRRYLSSITHIGTISHYTIEQGKNTPISLPIKSEQEKIGAFFKQLDVMIALQLQSLEQLQQYKKVMLQKMFPQKGERVPEVRFDGFSGNWEQKKLGNIVKVSRGLTYKPTDVSDKGIRVLRSSNINKDTFKIYEDDIFVNPKKVNINYAKIGDILITAANGSTKLVGKHAIIDKLIGECVHGGFMLLVQSDTPYFINSWMETYEYKKIVNLVQGGNGSIGNLSKSELEGARISIPKIEEQQKIGIFFKQLDDTIALHKKKLEDFQQLKKALLQYMFV